MTPRGDKTETRRAEESLQSERDLLQAVMNGAKNSHLVYLDRDFNFVRVNEAYARTCGFTPEQMIGKNHFVLYPNAENEAIFTRVRDSGEPVEIHDKPFEFPDQPGRGVTYWDWTLMPVKNPLGQVVGLVFSLHETTGRKQAELKLLQVAAELKQREKQLRLFVDYAPVAIAMFDQEMRYVAASRRWLADYGLLGQEVLGRSHYDVFPEIPPRWKEIHRRCLAGAVERAEEDPFDRADGTRQWLRWDIRPWHSAPDTIGGIVIFSEDISSRKAAEESLRQSEVRVSRQLAEIQSIYDSAQVGLCVLDRGCRYVLVNHRLSEINGIPAADHIGKTVEEIVPTVAAKVRQIAASIFRTGEGLTDVELSGFTSSKPDVPRSWLSQWLPMKDGAGRVAGINVVVEEVTERKRAEEALRKAVAELARSNKELEQFASVVSHDLQEPLRMVTAFAGLLKESYQGKLDAIADEYIGFAVEGATRMQALISALLSYSRIGAKAKQRAPTRVQDSLDAALANLKAALDESGAVISQDELPTVMADGLQLTQVMQNLIGNAIKYRAPGTRPEIHIGARRGDDQATDLWLLSVRDNGIGIDPQYKNRIFEIFQRLHTREEYDGTGVGLAICKKIVEGHGGRIWMESQPGHGSTFFFTMPS